MVCGFLMLFSTCDYVIAWSSKPTLYIPAFGLMTLHILEASLMRQTLLLPSGPQSCMFYIRCFLWCPCSWAVLFNLRVSALPLLHHCFSALLDSCLLLQLCEKWFEVLLVKWCLSCKAENGENVEFLAKVQIHRFTCGSLEQCSQEMVSLLHPMNAYGRDR